MRYDFWATVSRVVVSLAAFFGKQLTEEQAEKISRESFRETTKTLLYWGESFTAAFFIVIWTVRAVVGTTLLTFAEFVLPQDLKAVETSTPLECPVVVPEVQATQIPLKCVGAIPDAFQGLELEGEQAYEKDVSKKRPRYIPVMEPVSGERYWYKRKNRYVQLVHCLRQAA